MGPARRCTFRWAGAYSCAVISALSRVKTFTDTGAFLAVQAAAAAALDSYDEWLPKNIARFQDRRDVMVAALRAAGFEVTAPKATMYLWVRVPGTDGALDSDGMSAGGSGGFAAADGAGSGLAGSGPTAADSAPTGSGLAAAESEAFARRALLEQGVVIMPGAALGAGGEGFYRVALTQAPERLEEAARRLHALM